MGVDPFDPEFSDEMKLRILQEAKLNQAYFNDVVCRTVKHEEKK